MIKIIHNIEFNEKEHTYKVDGMLKPCVSDIITGLAMVDFGAVPKHHLIEGRERGKEVHSICESFDKGKLVIPSIDPRLVGYFKGWLLFCKSKKMEWLEIEKRVYSKSWQYCGTLDRIGIIDGKKYILDIKTSAMKYPSHSIQTALYQMAYEEMTGTKIKGRMVLVLTPDGKYVIEEHKSAADFSYAISCVMTYRWKVSNGMDADIKYNQELYKF